MRNITNGIAINGFYGATSPSFGLSTITLPLETPIRVAYPQQHLSTCPTANNYNNGDLTSMDSSGTYASCQTHPFVSQGDLTSDVMADAVCNFNDLDMNNLYINPLEKEVRSQVKKSASGDTALRSLDESPMDEGYPAVFESRDRGSRVSLNEPPLPKHRKTRFQQGTKPTTAVVKARFEASKASQESLSDSTKKCRNRSSFMPAKSLASATKLINQHLFGIQSISSKGMYISSNIQIIVLRLIELPFTFLSIAAKTDKMSLSNDSIDSASPNLESHRRSKSILKNKSESSKISSADPESERLLADNLSGAGVSDISVKKIHDNIFIF